LSQRDVSPPQSLLPLVRRLLEMGLWLRCTASSRSTLNVAMGEDVQIRSVGYDRRSGRLEIEFTWTDDVRQFYPVAPAMYRQIACCEADVFVLETSSRPEQMRLPQCSMLRGNWTQAWSMCGRCRNEVLDLPVGVLV
jgi:KTSC domain